MKKICKRCGTEYEAERHLSRYCSPTCRQYAYLERHGLEVKNPDLTGTNSSSMTEKEDATHEETQPVNVSTNAENNLHQETSVNPVNPVNVAIDVKQPQPVNNIKSEPTPIKEKHIESPVIEEKKKEQTVAEQKQTVNPVIDVNAVSDLMKEIKLLKEQNEKIMLEQKQVQQKPNPAPVAQPINNTVSQNQNKTFSELLDIRLKDLYGADMFNKNNYGDWSYSGFSYAHWINERLKSYVKTLLKMHDTNADINRIKYISEKLQELKKSYEFNHLPDDYPYINDINGLIIKLQLFIEKTDGADEVEFRIAKPLRADMRAIVIEIGNTAPDVDHCPLPTKRDFTQNRYYQAAKRKGFDVLKM